MKKALAVLLSLVLLCGLAAGCGKQTNSTITEISGTGTPAAAKKAIPDFVDLTVLSSTMVYAEVNNMMMHPTEYEGKTIKARGTYQAEHYEATDQYYHFVNIADAAACCAQGLEFVWNGDHTYPDDYPENFTWIEVTGVFESYEEEGNTWYRMMVDEIVVKG